MSSLTMASPTALSMPRCYLVTQILAHAEVKSATDLHYCPAIAARCLDRLKNDTSR